MSHRDVSPDISLYCTIGFEVNISIRPDIWWDPSPSDCMCTKRDALLNELREGVRVTVEKMR